MYPYNISVASMRERGYAYETIKEGEIAEALCKQIEDTRLDTAAAYKATYTYLDTPRRHHVQCSNYYAIVGKHCYLIHIEVDKVFYDMYAKDIDTIVKSFKLIPTK